MNERMNESKNYRERFLTSLKDRRILSVLLSLLVAASTIKSIMLIKTTKPSNKFHRLAIYLFIPHAISFRIISVRNTDVNTCKNRNQISNNSQSNSSRIRLINVTVDLYSQKKLKEGREIICKFLKTSIFK